jgi:hypothetical protein
MSADSRRLGLVAALLLVALLWVRWRPAGGAAAALPAAPPPLPATTTTAVVLATAPLGPDPEYVLLADSDWWSRTPDEALLASPYDLRPRGDLSSLPFELDGWQGVDEPPGDADYLTLGKKQNVLRRYWNDQGEMLWLRLLASADWNMFYHNPPTCYRSNGWELEPESHYDVPVGDTRLRLRGFVASQPAGEHLVLFGFLWANQYRDMADGTALFEVVVPLTGDRQQAARLATDFASLLFSGSPRSTSADAGLAQHSLTADLGGQVALVGFDQQQDAGAENAARRGETLPVTLYWQAIGKPAADYTVFVQLLRPAGDGGNRVLAQVDRQPYNGLYPTSRWRVGQVLKESYDLNLPPDAPAGDYELIAGMYSLPGGQRLGEAVSLGPVHVAE